jgi:tripartite-type tricarboxylate transporter receptor subunit TctC
LINKESTDMSKNSIRPIARRTVLQGMGMVALVALSPVAAQSNFPDKPVTMVVPFTAGGPTDTVARSLAQAMEKSLGQPVVVENKPSAGGIVAPAEIARSKPDGYRILIHHIGMSTAPALYRKLSYKPLEDFEHLGLVNGVPMTLIARPDFPANNMGELMTYVKANSKKINLANAGLGAASHLCGLMFQSAIGTPLTTVQYKGTGPAMTDLIGGQTDIMCDQTTNTTNQIKGGRVKAYAITTPKRLETLKEVPTAAEGGLKGFEFTVWHGLYAPKGTPADITGKLNASLRAALKDEGFRKRMAELGAENFPESQQSPAEHRKLLASETSRWGKLIAAAGEFAD